MIVDFSIIIRFCHIYPIFKLPIKSHCCTCHTVLLYRRSSPRLRIWAWADAPAFEYLRLAIMIYYDAHASRALCAEYEISLFHITKLFMLFISLPRSITLYNTIHIRPKIYLWCRHSKYYWCTAAIRLANRACLMMRRYIICLHIFKLPILFIHDLFSSAFD